MQLITSSAFTIKTFMETKRKCIKSGLTKGEDCVSQGYEPTTKNINGVLQSYKNYPIAYWDIPTLNQMVFSKHMWNSIHDNPYVKAALDNKAMWGEAFHADSSEVLIPNVALRVNDWHCIDNNLVVGDIDILDTPNGNICYTLAQSGTFGLSSRGYGDLIERNDGSGLSDVGEDDYLHVCFDAVTFPAVPAAMSLRNSDEWSTTESINSLEQELRNAVLKANDETPNNPLISKFMDLIKEGGNITDMFNNVKNERKSEFPLASSIHFKERKSVFPKNVSFRNR